jgi:uncharacterized protein (DUF488 family)
MALHTIGHGARPIDTFGAILTDAGVELVVDVRRHPASRRHPQFNRRALTGSLAARGIAYESWADELGGRREPLAGSPHVAWTEPAFRGFADHLDGALARSAIDRLVDLADDIDVAVLCAESDWQHCHRRLIADAATLRGATVDHLGAGAPVRHELHPALRTGEDGWPVYDVGIEPELFPRS